MDHSLPSSSVYGILQARILEWIVIPCSRDLPDSGINRASPVAAALQAILIPACDSSSSAFCMIYSAYKLNKKGDNIQPCHSPFPILNPVSCSMSDPVAS